MRMFKHRLSVNNSAKTLLKSKTIKHSKRAVIMPIIKAVVTRENSVFLFSLIDLLFAFKADVILLTTKGSPLDTNVSKTIYTENEI